MSMHSRLFSILLGVSIVISMSCSDDNREHSSWDIDDRDPASVDARSDSSDLDAGFPEDSVDRTDLGTTADGDASDAGGRDTRRDTLEWDVDGPDSWAVDTGDDEPTFERAYLDRIELLSRLTCKAIYECPETLNPRFVAEFSGAYPPEECPDVVQANVFWRMTPDKAAPANYDYDAELARECFDQLEADLASDGCPSSEPPVACEQYIQGKLVAGETCAAHVECETGSCRESLLDDQCLGKCADPIKPGFPCGPEYDRICERGSMCMPTEDGGRVCTPSRSLPEGHICDAQNQCGDGLDCDSSTNQCAPAHYAGPGESCRMYETICPAGMKCLYAEGRDQCWPVLKAGESCSGRESHCATGTYCVRGTCETYRKVGESCTDVRCNATSRCSGGICEPQNLACE